LSPDGPDIADIMDRRRAAAPGRCGGPTGDIPLAARCVEAGARVLKHNGEALNLGQYR